MAVNHPDLAIRSALGTTRKRSLNVRRSAGRRCPDAYGLAYVYAQILRCPRSGAAAHPPRLRRQEPGRAVRCPPVGNSQAAPWRTRPSPYPRTHRRNAGCRPAALNHGASRSCAGIAVSWVRRSQHGLRLNECASQRPANFTQCASETVQHCASGRSTLQVTTLSKVRRLADTSDDRSPST